MKELVLLAHREQMKNFFVSGKGDAAKVFDEIDVDQVRDVDPFNHDIMKGSVCHVGSPWIEIYVGREYSDRAGTVIDLDDYQASIECKRKRNVGGASAPVKKHRSDVVDSQLVGTGVAVRRGDAYLNIVFQVCECVYIIMIVHDTDFCLG